MSLCKRLISFFLVSWIFIIQAPMAQAGFVQTQQALQQSQQSHVWTKDQVSDLLQKQEVRDQLVAWGVSPEKAQIRISQMTDQELATLNKQIDQQPAGSGVIGVILVVFIVFVITDMLGATDVFSFVHDINH